MEAVIIRENEIDRERAAVLLLPLLALLLGEISFGRWWWTIGFSALFPFLLFRAHTRKQAFLIAALYHMGATDSLALAAGRFYGDQVFFGVGIWALGNIVNGALYATVWHKNPSVRLFTIPLGVIVTALPPFGVLGWANPLTSAGIIFPGSGLAGFAYLTGVYFCLAANARRFLTVFAAIAVWCIATFKTTSDSSIAGISTEFDKTDDAGLKDYRRQTDLQQVVRRKDSQIVLVPEGVVTGGWTEVGRRLWAEESRHVLLGADLKKEPQENIIVDTKSGDIYRQRQPIPFSMWRPFDSTGYAAHWFQNPVMNVADKKLAPLVCYEGFLVWPVVHSYVSGASYIIATGNYWWAGKDEIPIIHDSIIKSWSRLFSMPYTMAVNL